MSVADAVKRARLVAYDGCHKIYVAMDEDQAKWFKKNYVKPTDQIVEGEDMLESLEEWWDCSCPCRFISAVYTKNDEPDFVDLISQFSAWEKN